MRSRIVSLLLCATVFLGMVVAPPVATAATGGEPLSSAEVAEYVQMQADADQADTLAAAGGAEAGTGTIVLATIGVLVLIGVVLVAAAA